MLKASEWSELSVHLPNISRFMNRRLASKIYELLWNDAKKNEKYEAQKRYFTEQ